MDKNICIFGDSITWGSGDTSVGGWTDRLKAFYQATEPDIEIYNLGITGNTTDDVIERFSVEARARNCTIAIFAIGINDSKMIDGGNVEQIELADFRANILELIEQAGALDIQIAFLGLTRVDESKTRPIPWKPDTHYINSRIELFDESIKNICEDKELPYLDLSEILEVDDMPDGLHPNTLGYEKLVTAIVPFLQARFGL
jgi:lysophospholipase L1-like esterase